MKTTRPEVEIQYMKRADNSGTYYFEVWVRSITKPERKFGTIVDRGHDERRHLGIAAGALAEHCGETFNEERNPDTAAAAAMAAYDRLNALNPIPKWGDEKPI
jgi:hypothetical protein